ncbi:MULTISPECIES: bacterioferritin [unclassified Iodobacter]|uniref:bacterioferritin n=1 Tax=unclassified Iodobacter TaxID=235634 RepID=UPI0025D517B1|nr:MULTISPECIES: bacterioferritin [unclassified Iodobacter]MDW5418224.1 bacterioferritin [Iodobacter sp. CM08]
MQGSKLVLSSLNSVLGNELIAINQFFLHARMYRNWGLKKLNDAVYHESIDAMKRADKLITRILMLEGLPNLQQLGKLYIGENTPEMLACDLKLVSAHLTTLRLAIETCELEQDYVSRDILEDLLEDEEEYVDWLETQAELQVSLGLPNYLQSQIEA